MKFSLCKYQLVGLLAATFLIAAHANSETAIGQIAPEFSAFNTLDKPVSLQTLRGQYVVLEWVNPACVDVEKRYTARSMQLTQKEYTAKGVTWVAINSTEPGRKGHMATGVLRTWLQGQGAAVTHQAVDADTTIAQAYGVVTVPYAVIIDPSGKVIYKGGVDDLGNVALASVQNILGATNYLWQGLGYAMAGKPLRTTATQSVGCALSWLPKTPPLN